MGLEIGADDYLTKPFSPRVLARMKAIFRRLEPRQQAREEDQPAEILQIGGIQADLEFPGQCGWRKSS